MSDPEFSLEVMQLRAENFVRALHVRQLLVNVCGPRFERPERREFRVGLGGGYTSGYGKRHEESSAWAALRMFLEHDARVQDALRNAESLGLRGKFGGNQEYNLHVFEYIFEVADAACDLIRERAFGDSTLFPGDKEDWQRRFDLYLRQNWTRDDDVRNQYRTEYELVDWPSPPRELWPLRNLQEFRAFRTATDK